MTESENEIIKKILAHISQTNKNKSSHWQYHLKNKKIFDNYDWEGADKIFYETCPWMKYFYSIKFPFIHKYDSKVMHVLVNYK